MTSPYNTRSTRTTNTATSPTTVIPPTTATSTTQHRHFCIVLTNNPRMIQSAQRMLSNLNLNIPASTVQGRQEQQQQQQQPRPQLQMQYLQVPAAPIRSRRRPVDDRQQIEQQVPTSTQSEITTTTTDIIATNMRAYEKEIEQDFQAQIQPILQVYLQKTRRSSPINSVFDMSSYVQI